MAFRRSDFNPRNDEEIVNRQAISSHQSFVQHVLDRVAGVVVSHGETIQTIFARCFDQLLWAADPVARKERMAMEINLQRHQRAYLNRETVGVKVFGVWSGGCLSVWRLARQVSFW